MKRSKFPEDEPEKRDREINLSERETADSGKTPAPLSQAVPVNPITPNPEITFQKIYF